MSKTVQVSPGEIKMQPVPTQSDEQRRAYDELCNVVFTIGALLGRPDVRRLLPKVHPSMTAHLIASLRTNADALETEAMAHALGIAAPEPPAKPPPERMETRWKRYTGPKSAEAPPACPVTGEAQKGSYECPCCQNVITLYFHDSSSDDSLYCSGCDHKHVFPLEDLLS
jgi:hypothetical protein